MQNVNNLLIKIRNLLFFGGEKNDKGLSKKGFVGEKY